MQGVILSAGRARSLILGDDGVRYTFTLEEWRSDDLEPEVGLRVDFEVRESNAADIFPIPATEPVQPSPQSPTMREASPSEPSVARPAGKGFRMKWWHWALAGGGALVVLGVIIAAVVLGIFTPSGPPIGKEVARHTHEGRTYALVEYGDELAIFSESGAPIGQRALAEEILRSYAWRQAIGGFDIEELTEMSQKVRRLDDSVLDVRSLSNDVVAIFDDLDDMKASIPFVGSVSAMDVVRDAFPGVGDAEDVIRTLDSELNDLGDNSASLRRASERIRSLELSSVSGDEMEALFADASGAARDLEGSVRTVKDFVSVVRESADGLASALRSASDTPIIGEALGDFARSAGRFESELSGLSSLLGGFESELGALGEDMRSAQDSADKTLQADMGRWLAEPYDTEWPPTDPERRTFPPAPTAAPAPTAGPAPAPAPAAGHTPFKLEWETSATGVDAGDSFTLTIRMYDLQQAGEHGGISVSFPSLTETGGSDRGHSSSVADVEAVDYTSGLSNVTFHQPGAAIYHRENNRQFTAEYLLVETDDAAWSRSDDRTLVLRITPKSGGEFPILIRGWLCADEYTGCSREPSSGAVEDQQGWVAEQVSVSVAMPSVAAPAPTAAPAPAAGRIAFVSTRHREDEDYDQDNREIYVMNADGTGVTRLTHNDALDSRPSWSPDGRRIAFSSTRHREDEDHDPDNLEIYVMNADGTGVTRLTHNDARDWRPMWSPDGRRIAFVSTRHREDEDYDPDKVEIYVMNADGTGVTRLTHNDALDSLPNWSPDGRRIAFTSTRHREDEDHDSDKVEIYVMNADGTGVTRLTHNDARDWRPMWSPDGRRIAFVSTRHREDEDYDPDKVEIYVMNADGTGVTRLTHNDALDSLPNWSPDGRRIAFVSTRHREDEDYDPDNLEIYVMNADGTGVTRLTHNDARDSSPSWSPAGERAAAAPATTQPGVSGQMLFKLEWETSATGVDAGDSFTLTIRMYDLQQAGEHGGTSVSFPSLTESGGSGGGHSSSIANVEAVDYTSGLANVTFHQPGGPIYHKEDNRQFAAEYLLVESDDASWSRSDDRTLVLRITPKVAGEFPIQIRGWLCAVEYTDCARNPAAGAATDQQGHPVEVVSVAVSVDAKQQVPPERIAFASDREGNEEIYVMNADGSGVTRLTDDSWIDSFPSMSRGGRRIAFMSDRDGNPEIYVMNTDGSGVTRLTNTKAVDSEPSWSPDGRRIAFTSDRDGDPEIYVMNADGSGVTRLTNNDTLERYPSWSPDGQRIAFVSFRDGVLEIYVINADGSGVTRLTNSKESNRYPSWSPDGGRIAFASFRDGQEDIYVMNADGSNVTRLTNTKAGESYPSWSSDGRRITFTSHRDGQEDIYVMNADGSGLTLLKAVHP